MSRESRLFPSSSRNRDSSQTSSLRSIRSPAKSLVNASKHSQADTIWLALKRQRAGIELSVLDNGIGFDVTRRKAKHFGLEVMSERADAAGGSLAIQSSPGNGALVVATFGAPRQENETDPRGPFPNAGFRPGLADLEVSATGEHQSGDRTKCDNDAAHELHVDSLLPLRGVAILLRRLRPPTGGLRQ